MEIIEQENLLDNVNLMGDYLMDQLNGLMDKHEIIGEVRGKGLFVGAELVKDRKHVNPSMSRLRPLWSPIASSRVS